VKAHNIEDVARDAASADFSLAFISDAAMDAAQAAEKGDLGVLFSQLQGGWSGHPRTRPACVRWRGLASKAFGAAGR
jgi:hypothetical protein